MKITFKDSTKNTETLSGLLLEELEEYLAEQEQPDYNIDYYSGYDIDSEDI